MVVDMGTLKPPNYSAGDVDFVWTIPTLAVGQTATWNGAEVNPPAYMRLSNVAVTSNTLDLNRDNDGLYPMELELSPAPEGTADLLVNSLEILPGPADNQRIFRAVVSNAGAGTARGVRIFPFFMSGGIRVVGVPAGPTGWNCSLSDFQNYAECSIESFAAGASATAEFLVEGIFVNASPHHGVAIGADPAVPEPLPKNNVRRAVFGP
jgi:hypothetical protein